MLKNEEKTYSVGPQASNKKALTSESPKSVESPGPGATKEVFSLEKWRRDFDEYAKRSLNEELVAKMQQDVLDKNKMEVDWQEYRWR